MNKVKVTICGKEYSLKSVESPSYITSLAKELEGKIFSMVESNGGITQQAAAILIALSAMDDAKKSAESIDNIRLQLKQYLDDAGKALLERDDALREVKFLESKIAELENDLRIQKLADDVSRKASQYTKK